MSKCSKCMATNNDCANFCTSCGEKIVNDNVRIYEKYNRNKRQTKICPRCRIENVDSTIFCKSCEEQIQLRMKHNIKHDDDTVILQGRFNKLKVIVPVVGLLIILLSEIFIISQKDGNANGNTNGNITNYGIKTDGTGRQKLADDLIADSHINVSDGWVYYIINGKNYRIKTDGSSRQTWG
jgi:hypothetical protein